MRMTQDETVTLTHSARGGSYDSVSIEDVSVTVQDNVGVSVTPSRLTVNEEDATGSSYEVVLRSQPSDPVTVTVSGTSGTEVTATPSTLTFTRANWDTPQSVTVTAGADANGQDEAVTLAHRASGGGYGSVSIEDVSVTVRDNDVRAVSVTPSRVTVMEEDATGSSYEVVLRTQPTETVTVTVSGTSGTEVTATPSTLTFTTENWDTPQSVTVEAAADANNRNELVTLTHRASGGDYGSVSIENVSVTVQDNDPGVTVTPSQLTVMEEDATGSSYEVVLTQRSRPIRSRSRFRAHRAPR